MLGEAERLVLVREVVKARGAGRMKPCTAAAERRRMVLENFMVLVVGKSNSKQRAMCLWVERGEDGRMRRRGQREAAYE